MRCGGSLYVHKQSAVVVDMGMHVLTVSFVLSFQPRRSTTCRSTAEADRALRSGIAALAALREKQGWQTKLPGGDGRWT